MRAKDFMLGNKEHEKYLTKLGIQIVNKDGQVQLMHVPDLAFNSQFSEVFNLVVDDFNLT